MVVMPIIHADHNQNLCLFWTEQDILEYIIKFDLPYASVYGDIIGKVKGEEKVYHRDELKVLAEQKDGIPPNIHLETTGCQRTGVCSVCLDVILKSNQTDFRR